ADEFQHDVVNRGLSLGELDKMTALVAAVRDAVGDGINVCIDCHGIYSVRDVILLAKRLEPFNLMFLEVPVPPENIDVMAKVTASTSFLICRGASPRRVSKADSGAGVRHAPGRCVEHWRNARG
ncbi:MAG TPA: hypothetical protein DIU35_08530, partial [Candidatus Latescibacteria bacterium]|nr:hypothetical protein [Candidatus Latescibacterota bacterium]